MRVSNKVSNREPVSQGLKPFSFCATTAGWEAHGNVTPRPFKEASNQFTANKD
jgi:hypothetical protein